MTAENREQRLVNRWRDILALHARTHLELDRTLGQHGLCSSDFEVLDMLSSEPDTKPAMNGYRVHEIAEEIHLSQSALSRLLTRLERDGLVDRTTHPEDRRGIRVQLTAQGREVHGAALPAHRAVLMHMLSDQSQE